jgi:putative ABC transport system permease protein
MLKSYLRVALRSIRRQRGFAFINIAGLAVGLACCLLIALLVRDELAYDRFHEHADRVYRVVTDVTAPNTPPDAFAVSSRPMGERLLGGYPEVESAVRLVPFDPSVLHEGEYTYDLDVYFAEPSLFEVFSFPLLEGDPATALAEPYRGVITERLARRFFGGGAVVGQVLALNDTLQVTITGVARDVPPTSHLSFDLLVSYATFEALSPPPPEPQWLQLGLYTYVLLRPGVDAAAFSEKIHGLAQSEYGEVLSQVGIAMEMGLEPLPEIYLHSQRKAQAGPTSDARLVTTFAVIALFVLLIACVNYMNLATARSVQRAREVGVRKTLGANRGLLAGQFLGESLLMTAMALGVALVIVAVVLPVFNEVAGKDLTLRTLGTPPFLAGLVALLLLVGVVAGSYPAAVLSGFQPSRMLKGEFRGSRHGAALRQGLVVFQFAVSVVLIAGTIVVVDQLHYMRSRDLGFQKEHLVTLDAQAVPNAQMAQRYEAAKQELLAVPGVVRASASAASPGGELPLLLTLAEGMAEGESRRMHYLFADHDFAGAYGLQLAAGRFLSRDFETDAGGGALLNETAVAALGWGSAEEALGRWVQLGGGQGLRRTVVGVVRDYHHFSLQQAVEPMVVMLNPPAFNVFTVRLETAELPATLDRLRQRWEGLFPGYPFTYAFVDEAFDQQYQAETRLTRIIGAFAGLAILIACLGLFGLAAYTTAQRRKEIGVRKVLGAGVPHIVALLSRRFAVLVGIAFLIGAPVAYFALDRFLDGFAYRIALGPSVFLLAGALALLIALATVSGLALRAATTDPVRSLRTE